MSAVGVRVSPEWLDLREPADAAARSAELAGRLARQLPATGPLVIHDLGGGSGAMGRWLAPRLPGPQHWVLHDRDADLLERAVAAPPAAVTVEARHSDVTDLAPGELAGASLVVTSALLDLLTADELARMLAACSGRPMLLALTVVGRVGMTPAEALDARVGAAFDAHQRRAPPAGPGRRGGRGRCAPRDRRRGRRAAEPVAARCDARRPDGRVARRMDRRRLRAGRRARRRGRRLPRPAPRAGGKNTN